MRYSGWIVGVVAALSSIATTQYAGAPLPTVDLGYEVHQAIGFNGSGNYYNFSNIRYAQPPVGDLRFNYPVAPAGRNPTVQNGSTPVICPQGSPAWQLIGLQFAQSWSNGSLGAWNYGQARDIAMAQLVAAQAAGASPDPRITEDCLFLDVFASKGAFDQKNKTGSSNFTGAPVIVWIHGGGYTLGSKTDQGNPAGLIAQSQSMGGSNNTGIIWVQLNYRLGAFGWLGGPGMQSEGGVANAALYDQRLAIQWVRERIHLFGGDPNRITVMGESAGAGSIMFQMTAFGGNKGVNFQQAIIQSPGWYPTSSLYIQDNTTESFYRYLNVSSLAEARAMNSSSLIRANALQIAASKYGQYTYGPTYDGIFVPAQPGLSLLNKQFAKNISVMVGHNQYEGVFFAPAYVANDTDFDSWLQSEYPLSSTIVGQHITQTLYPPIYDGSQGYTSPITRAVKLITEQIFTCNTNYLTRAANGSTYNYEFEVPPALHGYDVPYTFYNGASSSGVHANIAMALQNYITQFAAKADPNGGMYPYFPTSGNNANIMGMNVTGMTVQTDDTANDRCKWWQKYLYT